MLKGKDIYTFVRFGGLDLKNQKGFSQDPETYHEPPSSRGFYAMPKIAQEFFLVGSLSSTQPGVFAKSGENSINKKSENPNYWRDKLREIRKEFKKNDGEIWHHLEEYTNHKDILQRHGSWIKTDIKVWAKSFSKMSTILRYGRHKYDLDNGINQQGRGKGIVGWYSKDHCEVFFDEKI
jgi:hypothetical protein